MLVSSTQAESGRQPLERQGATPRPNAPPPAYRKPLRLAVPALLALLAALAAGPAAAQTSITQTGGGATWTLTGHTSVAAGSTYTFTLTLESGTKPSGEYAGFYLPDTADNQDKLGTAPNNCTSPKQFCISFSGRPPNGIFDNLGGHDTRWALLSSTSPHTLTATFAVAADVPDGSTIEFGALDTDGVPRGDGLTITVSTTATLSTDATLTNLALEDFNGDPITLNETFASTLLTYTASVTNADTQIDVLPTRSDANATIEYLDGDGVALPDADPDLNNFQVDLDPGDNVIQVKVTAEDTTITKTYMVTVTRAGTTDTPVTIEAEHESIGAGLEDLLFTLTREGATTDALEVTVTITQAQSWLSNLEYTVTFSANNATAELTITASNFSFTPSTTGDLTATVTGDGIDGGSDTVAVISTSEPPITISYDMSDYTFAENSTDAAVYLVATLDAAYPRGPSRNYFMTFSTRSGTAKADEDYAPISERESFTRSEYGRDAVTDPFVARKLLSDFGFAIVDDAIYEGSERLGLVMQGDPPPVAGMAVFQKPDGTTCEPFVDCPNPPFEYPVTITDEGDLPALLLSAVPVSIAEEDDDGTTDTAEHVSTVTVEITNGKTFAVDQTVTLTFSGTATQGTHYSVTPGDADPNTAGHQVVLRTGDSSVEVTVTATGNDTADRNRTVTVAADLDGTAIGSTDITILDDETPLSTDATLSGLALSGVTLAPTFASATEDYTATVVNAVMQTTVTATQTHSGATVAFKDGDDTALTNPVTLAVGANVIKAVVTAEDTTTMKTYMVTVTRATITTTACLAPTLTGRMQIWTGTVTVGTYEADGTVFLYGFGPSFGALDDTQFRVGTNDYTVDLAQLHASASTLAGRLEFSLTSALAAADSVGLTLHVCDAAFAFADAEVSLATHTYGWPSAGLDWSSDTSRTLYLSVPSDTTAPSPDSAAVASDGEIANVVFDEALAQPAPTLSTSAFTLTADGVELDIQNMSFGADTLVFNLASGTTIYAGQTVRLSYDKTAAGADALEDAAGNEVASFTDFPVTNNSTVVNNPPTFSAVSAAFIVHEHTVAGQNVGNSLTATDADNDPLTYTLEGPDAASFNLVTISGSAQIQTLAALDHETKSSYEVSVKADDGHGGTDTVTVTIDVSDVAEPPAQPAAPSVSSVADSTTSLLVTWTAPENTGRPAIDHYDLQYRQGTTGDWTDGPQDVPGPSATIMSLTANTLYQVQVLATNDEGDSPWSPAGEGQTNTAGNTAPMIFFDETALVEENAPPGVDVGSRVDATDADNDPLIFTLEGTDAASFNLVTLPDSARLRTKTGVTYDYETKSSYSVMVKVDDGHGGTATASMTINVTDVNEPPARPAAPSVSSVADSTTSLLVTWTAPENTGRPAIDHYDLQYRQGTTGDWTDGPQDVPGPSATIMSLTAAPTAYQVQVRATNDEGDGPWSPPGRIRTTPEPSTEPAIVTDGVQVTSTPATGNTYGRGETIAITVTFDEAATVDTSGGTPRIAFHLDGGLHRWAEYRSGSGGTALVFTYTVQAGDMAADGIRLEGNLLKLQGGTIRAADDDTNTVNAILTYADTGLQSGHKVNGSLTTADATLSDLALSGVTLDSTFVSATETYTATVVNSVRETTVTASPTQSGARVELKDRNDTVIMNPVDLAVGANVIKAVVTAPDSTTMKTYMVTVTLAPAIVTNGVQVTSTPATGNTYGRGETIKITVTFDNAVMVGGTPRIAFHLDGGLRWAEYSRGSGGTALVFTYTVLADDRAVNGILLAAGKVELFGGTIRAVAADTVDAILTYADPGLQSGHKVNGSLTTTLSTDATLSDLTLSGVTLDPTFVSSTEDYTASVANTVTQTTVTASPTHPGATVAFQADNGTTLTNPVVTLDVGSTVIKAVVTAEDGNATKTYMVTVTRDGTTTPDNDDGTTPPPTGTGGGGGGGGGGGTTNSPPAITTTSPQSVAENMPAVVTLAATDTDSGDTLTWSKNGGADASAFTLTTAGVLSFASAPNFEDPTDTGTDNGYEVTVRVSDGTAPADLALTVNVTDVAEQPDRPAAPAVSATAGTTTSLDVGWTAPGLNGGPALTGYDLQYREGTSGPFTEGPQAVAGLSTAITDLMAGTAYQVQVRALNGETPSDWSPSGTGSTEPPEPEPEPVPALPLLGQLLLALGLLGMGRRVLRSRDGGSVRAMQ